MSLHFSLVGLPEGLILSFWPFGLSFPPILAVWALTSIHFAFLACISFILPSWVLPVGSPPRSCQIPLWKYHFYIRDLTARPRNIFWWFHRLSSILKRPLAETEFLLARFAASGATSILKRPLAETVFLLACLVASTPLHPQTTRGQSRFFAGQPCGANPAPSSKDSWPKPIFCWPALWRQSNSILKRPLAETDFLLTRFLASGNLHPQTTPGRNQFFADPLSGVGQPPSANDPWPKSVFCRPALWHRPSCIYKGPLAETVFFCPTLGRNRFFAGLPCRGIGQPPSANDPWPKPILLLARRVVDPANAFLQATFCWKWAETGPPPGNAIGPRQGITARL